VISEFRLGAHSNPCCQAMLDDAVRICEGQIALCFAIEGDIGPAARDVPRSPDLPNFVRQWRSDEVR